MKTHYLVWFLVVVWSIMARAETTLLLEAAESPAGPWVLVPIGPEALDLRGGIAWDAFPERFRLVRLRVVQDGRDVTADYVARPGQMKTAPQE